MDSRLLRYVFHHTADAVIVTGCTWDKAAHVQSRYVYSCETSHNYRGGCQPQRQLSRTVQDGKLDLYVMGAFTVEDIGRLIYMMHNGKVDTVILPYVTPIQRLVTACTFMTNKVGNQEIMEFVQNPYEYMKKAPVRQFYFLYGNGTKIESTKDTLYEGHYFEAQDAEVLSVIEELEGQPVPVVKAGYLVENRMLFYFGYYGTDVYRIRQFVRDYRQMGQAQDSLELQMHGIVYAYQKEFDDPAMESVTMFCGPVEADALQKDCVFDARITDRGQECHTDICGDDGRCSVKCFLHSDYETFRAHRTSQSGRLRTGMLLLGNVRLNEHIRSINGRYASVREEIRAVSLPNGGDIRNWDSALTERGEKNNTLYWLCPMRERAAEQMFFAISKSSPRSRIVWLNGETGCCFNGYITQKPL